MVPVDLFYMSNLQAFITEFQPTQLQKCDIQSDHHVQHHER